MNGITVVKLPSLQVIHSQIHTTSYQNAVDILETWIAQKQSGYVIAANVHVVMTGYWHRDYQKIIDEAALVTPDGMPLVWGLRLLGSKEQSRVYGPDLMLELCHRAAGKQIPIYLYGGTCETLEKLQHNLQQQFPHLIIAGSYAPPFRQLTSEEEAADVERINASGAKIIFVGLGCPKQEEWMYRQRHKISAVMIGVGAAFDFHSGRVSQAPRWMMHWGLEWLYRLTQEPKRLWQRYLIHNPVFLILFMTQLLQKMTFVRGDRPINPRTS